MKINDSNMSTSELSSLTSSNASRVHLAHGEQNEHSSHNSNNNNNNNNNHSMSCNDFLLQSSLVNGANFQYMPKCPLCDKTFANSSNLKHHMNTIHFNEAKWICNECGKVCTSKSNLKVHLRVHLRVKPYYCRWCDYNCMHHSSIRDHLSKCHPEKSHNSSEPGYIFNSAAVPEPELSNYDLTLKNFESSESQNTSMQLQDINNNKKQTQTNMNIKTESYSSEDNIKHSADLGKHDPNESTTTNKSKLIKHHENNIHHHQHQHHHHLNNSKSNLPIISNKKKKSNKIRKLEESFLLSYKNDNKKSHHDITTLNNTTNKTNNNLINGADNQNVDFENSHSDSESSGCHHPHVHLQKDVCSIGNNTHFSPYHDDTSIKPTCSSIPPAISSFLFSPSLTGFPSSAASDLLNNLLQNSNIFKQFTQSSSSTSANNQINNLTANLIQRLNATAFMNQLNNNNNNNNSLPSISNQQVGQNCPLSTAVAANPSANNNNLKTKHLDANGLNALDLTTSQEKKKLKLSSTSNSEHAGVEESPVSPASSLSSSISASSSESSASASSLSSSTHFSPTSMQSTNSTNSTTSTLKTASKPNSKILNKSNNKKAISDVINRLNLNLPNRIKKSHNTAAETTDQKTSQIKHEHEHDNDDDHEEHEFSTSNGRNKNNHDDNNISPHHFYASNEIKHETTNDDDDNDDDPDADADEHFDNFKTSENNDNKHFVEMTSLSQRQQQQNSNATNNDIHDDNNNNENTSCSYKCKYCNIIFDEYSLYSIHAGMHSNSNPWKCNVCGHVCSNKVDFAVHILHLPKI